MSRFRFGPHFLGRCEVFYLSPLSFAFVNLKPVVPGHVLVSPRRLVRRFHELTQNEVCDLWSTAQKVSNLIEKEYDGTSLSLVIQDGPDAGQTVPHVHIHVMPRHKGDFKINDQIYDELNKSRLDNDFRTPRSQSEMVYF
ncbi:Dinucleoside triphosphate hydrolase, variant 2 [Entomophthora muscae]|uniref:Dinucleoside triphosphate hydrolase, variant 2 n=1 Tax=Entomophthora muscae TaxID=34485 RepID=A0ACC2UTG4_9FUNG|nr:Dinucleoside triphosphate hydrolase, variant 2 [Entomophthora muscae]